LLKVLTYLYSTQRFQNARVFTVSGGLHHKGAGVPQGSHLAEAIRRLVHIGVGSFATL